MSHEVQTMLPIPTPEEVAAGSDRLSQNDRTREAKRQYQDRLNAEAAKLVREYGVSKNKARMLVLAGRAKAKLAMRGTKRKSAPATPKQPVKRPATTTRSPAPASKPQPQSRSIHDGVAMRIQVSVPASGNLALALTEPTGAMLGTLYISRTGIRHRRSNAKLLPTAELSWSMLDGMLTGLAGESAG